MTVARDVETTRGLARVYVDDASDPQRLLVLGHGAGGGVQAPDLAALASALPDSGTSVWRVEQPWRVAGKRVAAAPSVLDDAWLQILSVVPRCVPVVLGGRSAGARVACRCAATVGAVAVVALAFPLHPPGKPEKSRAAELDAVDVPTLVVQGAADPFGRPADFAAAPGRELVAVPGDHSLRAATHEVVEAVAAFVAANA